MQTRLPQAPAALDATLWLPVTVARYWEALGAVPPQYSASGAFLVGEPYRSRPCSITGEILETYDGFFCIGPRHHNDSKFFAVSTDLTEPEFLHLISTFPPTP